MKKIHLFNKRFLGVALLILGFGLSAQAQKAEIGFRAMPTFSGLKLNNSTGNSLTAQATVGFGVGGFLAFLFTDNVAVQAEVIYNSFSQKYTEADVERKVVLKYVNIPLLLSLNTGKTKMVNLNVSAGPQLGVSVGSKLELSGGNSSTPQAVLAVKKGDIGFAYGAGIDFGLNEVKTFRLGLGYRGVAGIVDISKDSNTLATNSYYILDRTHIRSNAGYLSISYLF